MAEFLLEFYVARTDSGVVERGAERALLAAKELTRDGTPIRFVRSIFVPEDETCFYLYEAGSAEAVREAARRAGLQFERIIAAAAETERGILMTELAALTRGALLTTATREASPSEQSGTQGPGPGRPVNNEQKAICGRKGVRHA